MTPQKLTTLTRRFLKQWEKWPEAQWSCAQITIVRARLAQDFSALAGWIEREPYSFFFFRFYLFIFRERRREGERGGEKYTCAREILIGCLSHTPKWGPDPQPRRVPWLGIKPMTFRFTGSTQSTEPHQPRQESYFSKKALNELLLFMSLLVCACVWYVYICYGIHTINYIIILCYRYTINYI